MTMTVDGVTYPTWMDAYGGTVPDDRVERVLVTDVTGQRHRVPVVSARDFLRMLEGGGGAATNWYRTEFGGLVRQSAFANVAEDE